MAQEQQQGVADPNVTIITQFNQFSTGKEVALFNKANIEGKTFVITGPSEGGIGAATAVALANSNPATIFLAGRSLSKIQAVIDDIKKMNPATEAVFISVDFSDFDSVKGAAKVLLEDKRAEEINGLINSAGIMCTNPYQENKSGIELQFATNHLGPFLWTNLLLPRVIAAKGRVVNVSSTGFALTGVQLDNYNFDNGQTYQPWLGYGQSKAANVLFTTYLNAALYPSHLTSISLQPGRPDSGILRHTTQDPSDPTSFAEAFRLITEKYGAGNPAPGVGAFEGDEKTLEQAASTLVVAVADERVHELKGNEKFLRNAQGWWVPEWVTDEGIAEMLWELSEKLVGEKFDLKGLVGSV